MRGNRVKRVSCLAVSAIWYACLCVSPLAWAENLRVEVDLSGGDIKAQWHVVDRQATLTGGELRLDGHQSPCRVFLKTPAFGDVSLSASYRVEANSGVMAIGFVIGSTDSATTTYVHYDSRSAILCKGDAEQPWQEIKRVSKAHKPDTWYAARIERKGTLVSVFFDNKLLYAAECAGEPGLVGFYASQTVGHIKDIVVTGVPSTLAKPWAQLTPPQNWTHLCTDAGAGGYEAFPDVCRIADGRLLAVFYAGYGHVSMPNDKLPKGGRVSGCFSSDEGQTWSEPFILFDGPYDDRDPSVVQLKDGRLACTFFTLKPKPDGQKGFDGLGSFIVTSGDKGKTWETEPRQICVGYYCSSPIRELSDGRLALGIYKQDSKGACGAVTFSEDGGKTWCAPIDIPTGGLRYEAETDLIELKDGSLFAALRGQKHSGWSVSKDGGKSWSVAELFGFPGHCHYLHRAPGDIILMAHRLPNTSLHYSLDECKTWSSNVVVDTVFGAYPSMVTLKDGTIRIVYYEEGRNSSIRTKRFRATRNGIEWLPLPAGAPEVRNFRDEASNLIPCTVYPPEQSGQAKPAGLVVHLPGAGGTHEFYNLSRPPYANLRQLLAERGYWVVVPGLGGGHWMNDKSVKSLDAVIAGMIAAEGIDPERVTIMGTSMGAGSGLIYAGKRPGTVRSICAIFPMTDFNVWLTEMPKYADVLAKAYGVKKEELAPIFAERSPLRHPEAFDKVAVYLLHGDADTVVPAHHSREFAAALKARGSSVVYREVPGFGHQDEIAEAYQQEIADFLTGVKTMK